jgi:hypothetical protein
LLSGVGRQRYPHLVGAAITIVVPVLVGSLKILYVVQVIHVLNMKVRISAELFHVLMERSFPQIESHLNIVYISLVVFNCILKETLDLFQLE